MKTKPTEEQIAQWRAQWAKSNPEEAARRAMKRKANQPPFDREKEENIEDVFLVDGLSEQEIAEVKREMLDLWRYLYDRRHAYLQHRNLAAAGLSKEEKEKFKTFILHFEGVPGFSFETEQLLIEGLKYPEENHELAKFSFKYLNDKYEKGVKPSPTLWMQLWSREFVPMDALRLMMKHDNERGTYLRQHGFEELFPMLVDKIRQHADREYERFLEATAANDGPASGRRARRHFFFTVLLAIYGGLKPIY